MRGFLFFYALILFFTLGCDGRPKDKTFTIAFSQASLSDPLYRQMLKDMYRQISLEDKNLHFIVRNAKGDIDKQIDDIYFLLKKQPDLLIVNPLKRELENGLLDSIYESGLPLILFNSVLHHNNFTATIGVPYFRLGATIAVDVENSIGKKGRVLFIVDAKGSHKSIVLKAGYNSIMDKNEAIQTTFEFYGGTEKEAMNNILSKGMELSAYDLIFASNDAMARGVYLACKELGIQKKIIGLNGLAGEHRGLSMVKNQHFLATYRIPSGGKEAIHIVSDILSSRSVKKYHPLLVTKVDKSNVDEVIFEANQLIEQFEIIDDQIEKLGEMNHRVEVEARKSRYILIASLSLLLLLSVILIIYIRRWRMQKALLKKHKQEFDSFRVDKKRNLQTFLVPDITKTTNENAEFFNSVSEWLSEHITNSNLKVEDVSSAFNMSQSSFYRRIKEISGMSVVALILQMRLEHAAKRLLVTSSTIEQIAYESGFNDAGYFSKCFRKTYGQSPNVFRNEMTIDDVPAATAE